MDYNKKVFGRIEDSERGVISVLWHIAILILMLVAVGYFAWLAFGPNYSSVDKDCGNAFGRVGEDTHTHQVDDGTGSKLDITHCHTDGGSVHPYSE